MDAVTTGHIRVTEDSRRWLETLFHVEHRCTARFVLQDTRAPAPLDMPMGPRDPLHVELFSADQPSLFHVDHNPPDAESMFHVERSLGLERTTSLFHVERCEKKMIGLFHVEHG